MLAVTIPRFGGPDVLELRDDLPDPVPAAGEVLVRVRATALNRADLLQRRGRYPAPPGATANIPGLEYAGEIAVPGEGVTGWRTGERVFGITGGGAHAAFVCVPATTLMRIPDALSWEQAAAVPEAFITAHDALVTQGTLQPGERVLVHAVGSGVGLAVTQVARALGATLFGTARTAEKLHRARAHGMDEGALVAGDPEAFVQPALAWSGGRGVDVLIDLAGGRYVAAGVRTLAPRGRLVLVGLVAGAESTLPLGVVISRRLTIRGTVLRSRTVEEKATATHAMANALLPLLASGAIYPVIDRVLPIANVREAHEALESDATFGKVVLLLP